MPKKLYQVKLLRTNKNGGFFKTLKEALVKQREYETKNGMLQLLELILKHRHHCMVKMGGLYHYD